AINPKVISELGGIEVETQVRCEKSSKHAYQGYLSVELRRGSLHGYPETQIQSRIQAGEYDPHTATHK
ncbi:hypothetical protein CDAR_87461, partial [Caerostris darwini]